MPRRDPLVAVRHMLDAAGEAVEMAAGRSRGDLDTNRMLNLAIVRLLEIVGEAATRVPEEFRARFPDIPWRDVSDLRNRPIHGYDNLDFDVLWAIVHDDLPQLIGRLRAIVETTAPSTANPPHRR